MNDTVMAWLYIIFGIVFVMWYVSKQDNRDVEVSDAFICIGWPIVVLQMTVVAIAMFIINLVEKVRKRGK